MLDERSTLLTKHEVRRARRDDTGRITIESPIGLPLLRPAEHYANSRRDWTEFL